MSLCRVLPFRQLCVLAVISAKQTPQGNHNPLTMINEAYSPANAFEFGRINCMESKIVPRRSLISLHSIRASPSFSRHSFRHPDRLRIAKVAEKHRSVVLRHHSPCCTHVLDARGILARGGKVTQDHPHGGFSFSVKIFRRHPKNGGSLANPLM